MAQIAARLGVSDRHLRRIFEAQFGVSPLQYLQTRRLLAAIPRLDRSDRGGRQGAPVIRKSRSGYPERCSACERSSSTSTRWFSE